MTESRSIPWKTISVEAVAIVVSILLAFAIDAWWAEKKDSEVERTALMALQSDFNASREQLAFVLLSLGSARTDFARFQSISAAELTESEPSEIRSYLTALSKNHTFDPVTTTLDALANDGRLGLISDAQLLAQLSHWQRRVDNIADISFELRAESVRVRRAMERHGGPFVRWRRDQDNLADLPLADGNTMVNMREDMAFMGTARSHQYALAVYVNELHELEESIDAITTTLEQTTTAR